MTVLANASLVRKVEDELDWDRSLDATLVDASDIDGVIRLTGSVRSYTEKVAAAEAAHRVLGVDDVINDLEVVPADSRTDTEIAYMLRHALEWDSFLPAERIRSTVADGWVTLEGSVPSYYLREDAVNAVGRLIGVRGVTNLIRVEPDSDIPHVAHDAIRDALQRQSGREADRIAISVTNGEVTLSGRVRSWAEKRAVIGAAAHLPGVRMLCDELTVSPYA